MRAVVVVVRVEPEVGQVRLAVCGVELVLGRIVVREDPKELVNPLLGHQRDERRCVGVGVAPVTNLPDVDDTQEGNNY